MIFGLIGISPIVIAVVLSGLLTIAGAGELSAQIFGRVSVPIAAVTGLLGVWMVLAGYLGLMTKTLPNGLAVAGIAAGLTRFWIIASAARYCDLTSARLPGYPMERRHPGLDRLAPVVDGLVERLALFSETDTPAGQFWVRRC
jgi:hypothetical protein